MQRSSATIVTRTPVQPPPGTSGAARRRSVVTWIATPYADLRSAILRVSGVLDHCAVVLIGGLLLAHADRGRGEVTIDVGEVTRVCPGVLDDLARAVRSTPLRVRMGAFAPSVRHAVVRAGLEADAGPSSTRRDRVRRRS